MVDGNVVQDFIKAIKDEPVDTTRTYSATVSRVDNEGVVWVYLAGSDRETPTASTSAEVKPGDTVTVEWRNNRLYIAGNYSNPSAGVVRVRNVEQVANDANTAAAAAFEAANNAQADAERAHIAADEAENYALSAQRDAQNAVDSANTAGIAASVAQAAAEAAQGDIDEQKNYFWHDTNGSHVLGVETGYRTDIDGDGMRIVESSTQAVVSEFSSSLARIGKENENNVTITPTKLSLNNDGNEVAYLDNQRFQGSDIVATNLYMQTVDASTGDVVGQIGWVMRSNGHLSLKLIS